MLKEIPPKKDLQRKAIESSLGEAVRDPTMAQSSHTIKPAAMEDIIMGGTAEANESHGFPNSEAFTASSDKQSVNVIRKNVAHPGPDSLQKTEEENRAFERRVHKLFIDLGDEIGVDLLLLSGSEDDPEVLAVKALWVQHKRLAVLTERTQNLSIRG